MVQLLKTTKCNTIVHLCCCASKWQSPGNYRVDRNTGGALAPNASFQQGTFTWNWGWSSFLFIKTRVGVSYFFAILSLKYVTKTVLEQHLKDLIHRIKELHTLHYRIIVPLRPADLFFLKFLTPRVYSNLCLLISSKSVTSIDCVAAVLPLPLLFGLRTDFNWPAALSTTMKANLGSTNVSTHPLPLIKKLKNV